MSIRGQLLFEDGYNYMHMRASLASQMDKVFYFDTLCMGITSTRQCGLRRRLERSSAKSCVSYCR